MKLLLQREPSGTTWTFGRLFIDGKLECDTLEDKVREVAGQPVSQWKIPKVTAIPRGTYKLGLHYSEHLGGVTVPILLGVEGYTYVLIHWGNFDKDTDGCILVGTGRTASSIMNSKVEFARLLKKIKAAMDAGEEVWLEVR